MSVRCTPNRIVTAEAVEKRRNALGKFSKMGELPPELKEPSYGFFKRSMLTIKRIVKRLLTPDGFNW